MPVGKTINKQLDLKINQITETEFKAVKKNGISTTFVKIISWKGKLQEFKLF